MDRATVLTDEGARPEPGDFSVCIRCGEILRFSEELTLRSMQPEELYYLDAERGALLFEAQSKVQEMRRGHL